MRWTVLILTVSVIALGTAIGMAYRSRQALVEDGVVLEPASVKLIEDPYEFQDVKILFQLRNNLAISVTVEEVDASCGCINLVTVGNEPILRSFELPPGQSIPLQATLHVSPRSGPQEHLVAFRASALGRSIEGQSKINFNVRTGLRTVPETVHFRDVQPGKEHSQNVMILDSYPNDGIRLSGVDSSDESRVSATLFRPSEQKLWEESGLKRRYICTVKCIPEEVDGTMEYSLRVVPADSSIPDLYIPVVVTTRKHAYTLTPEQLVVVADRQEKIRRTVSYVGHGELFVMRAPRGIHVRVEPTGPDQQEIEIECDLTSLELPIDSNIIIGDKKTNKELFSLPLNILPQSTL